MNLNTIAKATIAATAITVCSLGNQYPAKANLLGDQILTNWNVEFSACYQQAIDDWGALVKRGQMPPPKRGTLNQVVHEFCQMALISMASGDTMSVAAENAVNAVVTKFW